MHDLVQPLSRNLSEQVSRRVGERILSGEYAPNQFLPEENALSSEFSVS